MWKSPLYIFAGTILSCKCLWHNIDFEEALKFLFISRSLGFRLYFEMGLLNNSQRRGGIMRLFTIQLVCWFAWFSSFCFAQLDLSEGVTRSVNFPTLVITCVGNLAVFVTSLIRGRLDLEIGARDVLDILASCKLVIINGMIETGLTTLYDRTLKYISL